MKLCSEEMAMLESIGHKEKNELMRLSKLYKTFTGEKEIKPNVGFPFDHFLPSEYYFLLTIKNFIEINLEGKIYYCNFVPESINIIKHIENVKDSLRQSV